jgi:AcrR family transcriptional regulator
VGCEWDIWPVSYKRMNETAANGTHADLLRAARALFASHGYDGTSVRAITAAAGANLGAITYHFGSKRELYNRVVADCAEPLANAVVVAAQRPGTVFERIASVVRAYFEQIFVDEDFGRVMIQAVVIGKEPPPAAADALRRVQQTLYSLVTEGQQARVIRAGDARLLSLSIVSVPLHLALVRRPLKFNTGIDLENRAQREAAIQHAIRFVHEALAAHSDTQS